MEEIKKTAEAKAAALPKLTADMEIIGKLDDLPNDVNGLTGKQLRDRFDEAGKAVKAYVNETLLPALEGPSGLVPEEIEEHNTAPDAHQDIRQEVAKKLDSATIKSTGIPEIVSTETLRTYFYDRRKETSRSWQFEVSPGSNENIINALGGFPDGHTASEKWFLYINLPYTEAGGFVIHAQLEGRTNGKLYRQDQFATLDATWHTTGWIRIEDVQKHLDEHNESPDAHADIRKAIVDSQTAAADALAKHVADQNNPHGVTYDQTGAEKRRMRIKVTETAPDTYTADKTYEEVKAECDADNDPYIWLNGREYRYKGDEVNKYLFARMRKNRSTGILEEYIIEIGPDSVHLHKDPCNGVSAVADCYDEAASPTSQPNTWYVSKDSPRPVGKPGMTIDVRWQNGHVDGLGYNISLVWGAPGGGDNETILASINSIDNLSGEYSIPAEGTVRYQLEEVDGRRHWRYVSGPLLPKQFSTAAAASTANKPVHGMEIEYLPGMEIYLQMDNGNTADTMRLVPDSGPALPVYGNGIGAKTGEIPAGYILHLVNSGDHWQIINGLEDESVRIYITESADAKTCEYTKEELQAMMYAGRTFFVSVESTSSGSKTVPATLELNEYGKFAINLEPQVKNVVGVGQAVVQISYEFSADHYPGSSPFSLEKHVHSARTLPRNGAVGQTIVLREIGGSIYPVWEDPSGGSGGGVTEEQLNEAKHTTMVVTAMQEGGSGYKADHTSTEIINHANAGGIVVLRYAGTDGRTLEIRMSGQTATREALFFQTFKVPGENKIRRVDAKVDYVGNVTVTDETINVATEEQFNQLNTQKVSIPAAGTVGQVMAVKAVDSAGKPTEFECVDQSGGGTGTVDDAMSDTSENAVQNKVIKAYVDGSITGSWLEVY